MRPAYPDTPDPTDDHGADGPAATARTSRTQTIEGKSGGTGKAKGIAITVRRYEVECRLDSLKDKGTITHTQWQAGIMFRQAWHKVVGSPCVTSSYGDRVSGGGGSVSVQEVEYRSMCQGRLNDAVRLLTPDEHTVVLSVCGQDEALLWCAGVRVWNRPPLLNAGLNRLADAWVRPVGELRG